MPINSDRIGGPPAGFFSVIHPLPDFVGFFPFKAPRPDVDEPKMESARPGRVRGRVPRARRGAGATGRAAPRSRGTRRAKRSNAEPRHGPRGAGASGAAAGGTCERPARTPSSGSTTNEKKTEAAERARARPARGARPPGPRASGKGGGGQAGEAGRPVAEAAGGRGRDPLSVYTPGRARATVNLCRKSLSRGARAADTGPARQVGAVVSC